MEKQKYRFVLDGEGCIIDLETDITWLESSLNEVTWEEMTNHLNDLNKSTYERYYHYRLPSFEEISNIRDLNIHDQYTYWTNSVVDDTNMIRYKINMAEHPHLWKVYSTNSNTAAFFRLIKEEVKAIKFISDFCLEEERFQIKPEMVFSHNECCLYLRFKKDGLTSKERILTINKFGQLELHKIINEKLKSILDLDQRGKIRIKQD